MTKDEMPHMTKDKNRYKKFVLYFEELDNMGIPYGTGDLVRKAEDLGLSTP